MTVRAKFRCNFIGHLPTSRPEDVCVSVTLNAVYDDGKANREWSKYTPSGEVKMFITNPAAIENFDLGKEYYLDFTPVEA